MNSFTAHIKRATQKVGLVVVALSSVVTFQQAYAVGTAANTDITNQATVAYQVGGAAQPTVSSNTTTFKVDRKVNVVVAGGNTTNTFPGATTALSRPAVATLFTVTNTGNGTDTFDLTLGGPVNQTGDDFDVTAASITYYDDNGTTPGVFDAGDTQITTLTLAADNPPHNVFLVADIPNTPTNNQNAVVKLTATSTSVATPAAQADNPLAVDIVIVNQSSNANDTYHIQTATLTVTKTAVVLADPINCPGGVGTCGANAPKAIPGATVEYTIVVANTSTTAAASAVVLSDTIPAASNTAFVSGSMTLNSVVLSDGADVDAGTFTAAPTPKVDITVGSLAASSNATATFRVTIN